MATQPVAPVSANHIDDIFAGFYTEEQLAQLLGRNVRTLRRWHDQRVGPPRIRLGSRTLYSKASLTKWLAENEAQPLRQKAGKKGR